MKLNYVGNLFVQDCHGTIIRIRCTNSLTNIKLNRLDITFQQAFPAMETIGQKMSGITFQASNLQGGRGRTARRKGRGVKARNALPWARHHNTHPDFAKNITITFVFTLFCQSVIWTKILCVVDTFLLLLGFLCLHYLTIFKLSCNFFYNTYVLLLNKHRDKLCLMYANQSLRRKKYSPTYFCF